MLERIISIVAAATLSLWATVVDRYHEFRDPVLTRESAPLVLVEEPAALDPSRSPFENILERIAEIASSTATSSAPAPLPTTTPQIPFTPIPVPTPPHITPSLPSQETPSPVVPDIDEELATQALLRGSIVNIICIPGGGIPGASGSGVVIDPRGIILTVAHIGQNFLLTDYPEENAGDCFIRTGSPARNAYMAELIYISPDWIYENPGTFLSSRPTGTGEDDFALLGIVGSLSGSSLPRTLLYLPLADTRTEIEEGDRVGIGSYAAEFLTSSEVRSSLYPTISEGPINDVYTFGRSTVDIFSVRAGSAAQEGSSGGAVINDDRELIGLISTRTVRPDLSLRDLQAITMNHIRRSFRAETGMDLDAYLQNDVSTLIQSFQDDADDLLEFLADYIEDARS